MLNSSVTIDANEYVKLKKIEAKMDLLEAGGVDNWEGYSISLFEGEHSLQMLEDEIDKEVINILNDPIED